MNLSRFAYCLLPLFSEFLADGRSVALSAMVAAWGMALRWNPQAQRERQYVILAECPCKTSRPAISSVHPHHLCSMGWKPSFPVNLSEG